jgi:hypothetical protein
VSFFFLSQMLPKQITGGGSSFRYGQVTVWNGMFNYMRFQIFVSWRICQNTYTMKMETVVSSETAVLMIHDVTSQQTVHFLSVLFTDLKISLIQLFLFVLVYMYTCNYVLVSVILIVIYFAFIWSLRVMTHRIQNLSTHKGYKYYAWCKIRGLYRK